MEDDLNIRAAKALGWTCKMSDPQHVNTNVEIWYPIDAHKKVVLSGTYEHTCFGTSDLKFTTSYDWAMLVWHEADLLKLHAHIKIRCCKNSGKADSYNVFSWLAQATPDQITEVAVEVLESPESPTQDPKDRPTSIGAY